MKLGDIVRSKNRSLPVRFTVVSTGEDNGEGTLMLVAVRPYKDKYENDVAFIETHWVVAEFFERVG